MHQRKPTQRPAQAQRLAQVLALLLGAIFFALVSFVASISGRALGDAQGAPALVRISRGATSSSVARLLKDAGLIKSEAAFRYLSRIAGVDRKLKAGLYRFGRGMSLPMILEVLSREGPLVVRFTVPEGYTLKDIAILLESCGIADAGKFIRLATGEDPGFAPSLNGERLHGSLEGYLFPDTYEVSSSEPEEGIISMMLRRFEEVVLPEYRRAMATANTSAKMQGRGRGLTLHEIITLASIVEKEAKFEGEKPLIASVFLNRLKRGMPLQSCASVQYVLEKRKSRLSYEDTRVKSSYNTYLHPGLPPGPISNPGLNSIRAVLYPRETDYLYFVVRDDGTHIFTKTYREHLAAARREGSGRR